MKGLLVSTIIIALMINQESGIANTLTPAVVPTVHVIKNARVHGKPKARLKTSLRTIPYNPEEMVVDDEIVLGRNHNRIEIVDEEEEELSDYVKIRLMLARMKAMKAYSMASLSK
jgi:hypothetical protein